MISELEDLQGNIGHVIEMLQVIRAKLDTQAAVISEIFGTTLEPQPSRMVPTTWPIFGLSPGFIPQVERAPGIVQSTQQTLPIPATTRLILWSTHLHHPLSMHVCSPILKINNML